MPVNGTSDAVGVGDAVIADGDAHIRILFDLTGEMLCVADLHGRALLVNPAWERITGYAPTDIVGQPLLACVHPDEAAEMTAVWARLGAGEVVRDFTVRFQHRYGNYRTLRVDAAPEGGLVYALARDVTDEVAAMQRVREYRDSLRRNAAGLGGALSHATAVLTELRLLHATIVASLEPKTDEYDARLDAHREPRRG